MDKKDIQEQKKEENNEETMICMLCGTEMIYTTGGGYMCPLCGSLSA